MNDDLILTFPRSILDGNAGLIPWNDALEYIKVINRTCAWESRQHAEKSVNSVQAIPCTYIQDDNGRYYVMRRIASDRIDLSAKLSLVIGGHVDYSDRRGTFENTLMHCLLRELKEESGIIPNTPPIPVGVIIDDSSIASSRHIGFVYKTISSKVSMQATEEFVCNGNQAMQQVTDKQLSNLSGNMDPWSQILALSLYSSLA